MNDLLFRIFNRVIVLQFNNQEYKIHAPDCELRYYAELYKQRIIKDYKYDLPLEEAYMRFLVLNRIIDADYETKIKNMSDAIRRLKMDLFRCGPRIEEAKKIRKNLQIMKSKLNDYFGKIEFYKKPTLEYFSETQKNKFILINSVYKNDSLVFNQLDLDAQLLADIIENLNDNDISITQFRKIARDESWRSYYLTNQSNLFGISAIELSEDQKMLCSFTRMYDSIYEHPERPSEAVIEDDDTCDGWLIFQREKNEKNSKQDFVSVDDRFQEVFASAQNQNEANSIIAANNNEGIRILKERASVLKNKNEVRDIEFRDVKLDIIAANAAAESKHIKNI